MRDGHTAADSTQVKQSVGPRRKEEDTPEAILIDDTNHPFLSTAFRNSTGSAAGKHLALGQRCVFVFVINF